jgi:DNA-binding XRE family transcriptional regulator
VIGREDSTYKLRLGSIGKIKTKPESNIKAARIKRGLKQEDVAKKLGISANSFGLKERGVRSFDLKEIRIMCWYFNCDPNTLVNIDHFFS